MVGLSEEYSVTGVDIDTLDITNAALVFGHLQEIKPEIVIHAAAFTDVDGCESNVARAMAVNGTGTGHLALACRDVGAKLVYYSTDYVFDGDADNPYVESDKPAPQTVYGKSKLAGERAIVDTLEDHAVLRIAWVYGAAGRNFVKTMLRVGKGQAQARQRGDKYAPLKVVDDQIGNPTWTVDVVGQTKRVLRDDLRGLYHSTSDGNCSWYQFARDIFEIAGLEVELEPCSSEQYPLPAPRPRWSVLENARLKSLEANEMRDYRTALEEFLGKYGEKILEEV
jgi:dTDP-4-dehydrorhamnose reductase